MSLIVFLVGPTAVGKTELAIQIAHKINAEIISCDSMQVYSEMNILSSKPSPSAREAIKHHLIDIISVETEYSAAEWRESAAKIIKELASINKIPLVVGGSGLYAKALIDGIFEGPSKNPLLRRRLYEQEKASGGSYLYGKLKEADAETAEKIHPNDTRRIVRALEVYYSTGVPISLLKKETSGLYKEYKVIIFGLKRARYELYRRIDARVEDMFDKGLIKEVASLKERQMTPIAQQALGYKEVLGYIEDRYGLSEAKQLLKRNTRRFAKRQITWFGADKRIQWIDLDEDTDLDALVEELAQKIKSLVTSRE